ncbi:MAG: cyclic nucleotide-binding domain-containing protein [Elusimicrobiota bacterium]
MYNLIELLNDEGIKKYFEKKTYSSNDIIFEEGEDSHTLYIIESGDVIIEKAINKERTEFKDIAIISKGNFIGEIAVFEQSKRTARARALTEVSVFEITRDNFFKVIKENSDFSIKIFTAIIKTLSLRISHTSKELTMLYDISRQLAKDYIEEKDFISTIIDEISIYFPDWEIEGFYYNFFNEEFEKIKELKKETNTKLNPASFSESKWVDDKTYIMQLKIKDRIAASIIFTSQKNLLKNEINDFTTIFNTLFFILSNGLEKTSHNKELYMLNKLKQRKGEI